MSSIFALVNRVAVVTGGYGYLGKSIVLSLLDYGAIVYVAARDKDKFLEVFNNIDNVYFLPFDIGNPDVIDKALIKLNALHGKIDIIVNNAFFGASNHPEKILNEEWSRGIEGGLNSAFYCLKAIMPYMIEQNYGKIINISSMYGVVIPDFEIYEGREHYLNPPNYGTAKSGLLHLTRYYAKYLAKYNINVNAISPGAFPSEKVKEDKVFINRLINKIPLNRLGLPNYLDGALILLASDASNYITGQNIIVDGGWTL